MTVTRAARSDLAPRAQTQTSLGRQPVQWEAKKGGNVDLLQGRADAFIEGGMRRPLFDARVQTRIPGGVEAQAYAGGPRLDFKGHADAKVSRSGVDLSVALDVNATLLEAGASGKVSIPVEINGETLTVEVDLKAEGVIGAKGKLNLDVHIGTNGKVQVRAGAEGFIGARAGLTGGVAVKHEGRSLVSASLEVSASAGASAKGHLDLDLSGDGIEFHVGGEATAGVGFGIDTKGRFDAGDSVRFLTEVFVGGMEKGFSVHSDSLKDLAGWTGDRFQDVKERLATAMKRVDWTPWN